MQAPLLCSPEALAHRARIATVIRSFRRTRPRVPFWELAAHRIPTLWTLYRGLIRFAPTGHIRFRVERLFERDRHLTGITPTTERLRVWHRWLDVFKAAHAGDEHRRAVLLRYSRLIAAKREKEHWKRIFRLEADRQRMLASRPILTGGLMRGSIYNKPLPRMRRQPRKLSVMIHQRRVAHVRRTERSVALDAERRLLIDEQRFERGLAGTSKAEFEPAFTAQDDLTSWLSPLEEEKRLLKEAFNREHARAAAPYTPSLLAQVRAARRERVQNRQRELARERAGDWGVAALRRRRQGLPAPLLASMSKGAIAKDRALRSPAEVGYVGMLKERMGRKVKNPGRWRELEEGRPSARAHLDRMAERIAETNLKRREETERKATEAAARKKRDAA